MRFFKNIFFILVLFITSINNYIIAQGNTPCTAVVITANLACVNTAGTTAALTYQSNAANGGAPSCASPGAPDGWYSFTPTITATYTIDLAAGTITDSGMSISTSASGCTSPTQLLCDDDSGTGSMSQIVTTLTAGTTYFIRIWAYGGTATGTFSICITQGAPPPPAPANDNCAGAYTVAVNSSSTCTSQTGGTVVGATASGIAMGSCFGTADDDVWYSFVATSTTHSVNITNVAGSVTDMYHSVYSGSCGSLSAALVCSDPNTSTITGLTIGSTYYIRVYTYTGTTGQTTTFSVCVTTPPPPPPAPANDNCAGSYTVPVNPDLNCTSQTGGTVLGATASGIALGACFGTADDDVWYSFVATNTTHFININNVAGSVTDMYHSVYSGACGSLGAALVCSDPNSSTVSGLTVGNTYYVRVYTYTGTSGQTSTFSVCVTSPPPPPANDNPCSATPAAVNATYGCTVSTGGTVVGATSSTVGLGACGGTADDDVWYSFVANNSTQNIDLTNLAGSTTDMYFSVHPGTCGAIGAALLCSDPQSGTVTGLTVGTTYYLRVYTWTSTPNQTSTFSVCIYPPPTPPTNDNPCSATPAPVNATASCTVQTGGTVVGATTSTVALGSCFGTPDDDVWYSFVANNSTQNISLNNLAGSTTDLYFSIHPGTCGAIGAALLCSDPESGTITGLTIGTTYYIRIYSYTSTTGQTSTFSLCIAPPPTPPANDNPCTATPAPVNATSACTVSTGGTVLGATASTVAIGACFGTPDDDVWYSFVANNSTQNITLSNLGGSTTDLYFSVHPGTCGAIGAALLCSDPESGTITGLTVGSTYYIRIYSYTSTTGQTSTFSLCITPPCTVPSNDNCSGAVSVPVNSSQICSSSVWGTICGATASGIALGACFGTADDDVWFSFVATNTAQVVSLNNVAGSTTDLYHSVYSGACGSLGAALVCSDPNTSTLTGLTIGSTYYIRVYTYTGTSGQTTTFSVCVTTPAPIGPCGNSADNNFCSNPASIVPSVGTFSSSTSGLYTADQPGNLSSVFCGSIENNSWYYFVATSTSASFPITSVTGCSSGSGIQAQVYSVSQSSLGCCTSFTSVSNCFNPGTNSTGTVTATGLVIGQTYLLMVDGNGGNVCSYTISNWFATGILPLELLTFVGKNDGDKNLIQWATSSEINTDYFRLEKSKDGIDFEKVIDINAAGNSQGSKYYNTYDTNPYESLTYYRLRLYDIDGTFDYSNIITIDNSNLTDYITLARPNPTKGDLEFDVNIKNKGEILIDIYNNYGILINSSEREIDGGYKSISIDINKYDSGIYLLKITFKSTGKSEIQKIIKN